MVFKQLNIVWNMCWNANHKLMYHAFEANAGTGTSKSHADTWAGLNGKTEPYTFHSAAYWGRANAWYLMALVDVLEAMLSIDCCICGIAAICLVISDIRFPIEL